MHPLFSDYCWQNGVPKGVGTGKAYCIIADPYRRWYSVEKYHEGSFSEVVYNSLLLDFRDLHPRAQTAWHKECIEETPEQIVHIIRNQDDRVLYREVNQFHADRCLSCEIMTPDGFLLTTHRLYYKDRDDPFNGVVLFDRGGKKVMHKLYAFSPEQGTFTDLLAEEWTGDAPIREPATDSSDRS